MRITRHDPVKIRRLLEERQSDGLTFQQLSERSGIPVHVLTYRASQDRHSEPLPSTRPNGFIEVVAAGPSTDSESGGTYSGIELVLSSGVRVLLDRRFDESTLARLLSVPRC